MVAVNSGKRIGFFGGTPVREATSPESMTSPVSSASVSVSVIEVSVASLSLESFSLAQPKTDRLNRRGKMRKGWSSGPAV